ncbi:polysaccharide deacetylase family protein [Paenibacillus lautus]|uniref:polysaccharide deacetylase family protein n=1 Tax=Paenibacillus lautus TaxID=1401 RepID=UPI001BCC7410|nr:polysaccharide deacetylase family protein [Paenibacillus lautus]
MRISRNDNKKSRVIKARRRLVVVLAASFLMIFLIGKLTAAPEEDVVAKENIVQSTEQPAKQKRSDGKLGDKVVYLTFDDGPTTLTDQFLDLLKEQDIQATFFMQGTNLQKTDLQESVKRATEEGHYVGAHSMSHDYKKLYNNGQFVSEMKETLSLIEDITGTNPKLVRPPYGSAPGLESEQVRNQVVKSGIKVWDWTIDSKDWDLKDNPSQIVENIKRQTRIDREVILMHEKPQTLQALPEIIAFYEEKGYEFAVYNDADHFSVNFQNDKRL